MHNIALELNDKGVNVTGSDDIIFDPSKTRLNNVGILPKTLGWFPEKIHNNLDAIILGMHARIDNPELIKAKKIGLPIYSYPEYIYKESIRKKRIVIGGSHGKTSITSMILYVLKNYNIDTDYIVGAKISGFNKMVRLTSESKIIILEGDEYLSSAIDRRPKFHLYKPHIAVISGISWDHINVFPSFENYIEQFRIFKNTIKELLVYYKDDEILHNIATEKESCKLAPYGTPNNRIENGITYLRNKKKDFPLKIFGEHNLQNINAARLVCNEIGISDYKFYKAITNFKGADNRLEILAKNKKSSIYKDFAHSPSKLKATTSAVKKQFSNRELISCMELYTFSSLTKGFLKEYKNSMNDSDIAIVYFNQETLLNKKLPLIKKQDIIESFGRKDLIVFTNSTRLIKYLESINWEYKNLLMMTSGNFGDIKLQKIINKLKD